MLAMDIAYQLGPDAAPLIPALVNELGKTWPEDSRSYDHLPIQVLIRIGPASRPAILKILSGGPSPARSNLISGLSWIYLEPDAASDPATPPYIEYLVILCLDSDRDVRFQGMKELGRWSEKLGFTSAMDPVITVAISSLSDVNPDRREAARNLLHVFEEHGAAVTPRVLALLNDPDSKVAQGAAFALLEIDRTGKAAVPRMKAMRQSSDPQDREFAEDYLRVIGVED
jgi:hypothetical protein